ncbi:hypothetical protein C4561_00105 [candidate division WWE3 bacterium]|jgi:predicted hydrolase (HD superfamily)|uniref:Phosphohydrolase n=1 Tax=candidate division WWE3 bacterium TaxID=2053526 RepID=A0A3A4ZNG2_UNCKA|nr:MAG: hypothetical protein C4561_00105 [candidate division WWE3 bacterium]
MQKLTLDSANELLRDKMKNRNLQRHCFAVGKTLVAFYDYYRSKGRDTGTLSRDEWEITGILHDSDWEITTDNPEKHTLMLLDWLQDYETPEEMLNVFRSHNNKITHLREPETLLEWTLECCDELTGFIVAVALVMPEKKLSAVSTERVLKKFKQKEFARQVDRTQITQCENKVGVDINTFIDVTLSAMQRESDLLGL